MSLSEEAASRARSEAIDFLEHSIVTLSAILGESIDDVSGDMEIPVPATDANFPYYEALKKQAGILEGLQES